MVLGATLLCAACGDDSTGTGGGGSDGGGGTGASGGGGPGSGGGATTGTGGGADLEALALVRGALFSADLVEAQTYHDMLASGGEPASKAAGDIAHDAYLGTTLLGTTENEFLALDRWSSDANMDAFYSDPDFQQAFGGLFSAPPAFDTFLREETFHGWGSLDAADGTEPHYVIVVRGRLADVPSAIQPQHDAIVANGEDAAKALGDVAHVIYVGRADPREAVFIDVWTASDDIESFYGDPTFQAAVGGLFESAPSVAVYGSTDWHQW